MTLRKKAFENIIGEGANAGNQQIRRFQNVTKKLKVNFPPFQINAIIWKSISAVLCEVIQ